MSEIYENNPLLFKKGKKLAQGVGVESMGRKSYINGWTDRNTILERDDFAYDDVISNIDKTRWRIYERERIQYGKPASAYHQTAIAKDIANVKRKRG